MNHTVIVATSTSSNVYIIHVIPKHFSHSAVGNVHFFVIITRYLWISLLPRTNKIVSGAKFWLVGRRCLCAVTHGCQVCLRLLISYIILVHKSNCWYVVTMKSVRSTAKSCWGQRQVYLVSACKLYILVIVLTRFNKQKITAIILMYGTYNAWYQSHGRSTTRYTVAAWHVTRSQHD